MSVKNNKLLQEDYMHWLINRDLQPYEKGQRYVMWAMHGLESYVDADDIIIDNVLFEDTYLPMMNYLEKRNINTFCITLKGTCVMEILYCFAPFGFNHVEPYVVTRKSDFGNYEVKGIRISKK